MYENTPQETLVENAVKKYYKMKSNYNNKYSRVKKELSSAGLSNRNIKKKLKKRKFACSNCKQLGGMIFTNKNRIMTAKCGQSETPCGLDLQIKLGRWMLLSAAVKMTRDGIALIKSDIIDLKLDLLFGLRTEEEIQEQFFWKCKSPRGSPSGNKSL